MLSFPLHFADPATLTAVGIGLSGLSAAGGLASSLFGGKSAPAMPAPSAPAQSPVGSPDSNKPSGSPSFLAAAAAPAAGQSAQKSLLGQ